MPNHPHLRRPTFIEPSFYRQLRLSQQQQPGFLRDHEWGVVLLNAQYFVTKALRTKHAALPSVPHVLAKGTSLQRFLVRMAQCKVVTNLSSDQELQAALSKAVGRRKLVLPTPASAFDPSFVVSVQFAAGRSADAFPFLLDRIVADVAA